MAAGRAEKMWRANGLRVKIVDRHDNPRWHPLWDGNPALSQPGEPGPHQTLKDCGHHRPYIREARPAQFWWLPYQPTPATLVFTPAETAFAQQALTGLAPIMLHPTLKSRSPITKDWGWARWAALAARLSGHPLVQLGPRGTPTLAGVRLIETPEFRQAAAVLAGCAAFVGHEGGMHHAAAAVRIPAVVIFGGFISPEVTGYPGHVNLFTGGGPKTPLGCGRRTGCAHCAAAMAEITPERVAVELEKLLASREVPGAA